MFTVLRVEGLRFWSGLALGSPSPGGTDCQFIVNILSVESS